MRFSPTLSFYIGRHFLLAFFSVLAIIVGLILLFDLVELTRRMATHEDMSLALVVQMALLKLPQMVHVVMPFAVMVGAMVAFWRLTRSAELVVARAAGVSVWQFLTPVVALVFLVGTFEITCFNPFAAICYARYERMQDELNMRHANPLAVSTAGLWLRESLPEGQSAVVHAAVVRQQGRQLTMHGISIFRLDARDRFVDRLEAVSGTLFDGYFDLATVWRLAPGREGESHTTLRLPTSLTLSKIEDTFASPEAISFWELPGYIAFFESAGFSSHTQRLYWHSLLATPFLLCAMALVAAAFSLKPNMRSGGLMARVGGGVASGFCLYFFSKLVYALGLSSTLPLTLAAWSPAGVTGLVGLASLFYLEDG